MKNFKISLYFLYSILSFYMDWSATEMSKNIEILNYVDIDER